MMARTLRVLLDGGHAGETGAAIAPRIPVSSRCVRSSVTACIVGAEGSFRRALRYFGADMSIITSIVSFARAPHP